MSELTKKEASFWDWNLSNLINFMSRMIISYPRAYKLIVQNKDFLVVSMKEPYAKKVYDMIRENETKNGTWTDIDEMNYTMAIRNI